MSTFVGDDPYTNSVGINGKLRAGEELTEAESKIVADVDRATAAAPGLDKDTIVYRGLPRGANLNAKDKAFLSVSRSREAAQEFADNLDDGIVIQVKLPKGTRALDTSAYQIGGMQYQRELLLPRGTRLYDMDVKQMRGVAKYDDDQPRDEGGKWTAGAERRRAWRKRK